MRKKRKYSRRKQRHREPPLPKSFKEAEWGHCRWCGKEILNDKGEINKRRHWHKECLHPYFIVSDHRYAKRQVKKRDKGICATCGKYCHYRWEWDCDHIVPLKDAPRDIKYWGLDNLCCRCRKCHKIKTAQENKIRKRKYRKK